MKGDRKRSRKELRSERRATERAAGRSAGHEARGASGGDGSTELPATASPARDEGWPFGLDLLLVVLPAIAVALHPLGSRDLPMHMAIGEWILDHGSFPTPDPFSFTAGAPEWVPHEWLMGVVFALTERAGGAAALGVLLCAIAALFALVVRAMTRRLSVGTSAFLLWSLPLWLMLGRRMILRPHLLASVLPFLLWVVLLRARERPRTLWLAPLVMALWVNVHGSFLLGLGIVGLDLIACGLWHPLPWRTRIVATLLSFAALLTQAHAWVGGNPLTGLHHALTLVGDPVFMEQILEWRAPFAANNAAFRTTYTFYVAMAWLALAALGAFRSGRRLPLSYRLFTLVTLLLFLRHQRFLMLLAPATLPYLPVPRWTPAWRHGVRLATVAGSLAVATLGYPVAPGVVREPGVGWDRTLPLDIVERGLAEFPDSLLPERRGIFCEYTFGGILMWRGKGELQPTMDGRNTVYGAELYLKHRAALDGPTPYREELLAEVGAVLIKHPRFLPARQELVERLLNDPRWRWEIATPKSHEPYLLFLKHRR